MKALDPTPAFQLYISWGKVKVKKEDRLFCEAQEARLSELEDHLERAEQVTLVVDNAFREYGFSSLNTAHRILLHITIAKENVKLMNDFISKLKSEQEDDD